MFIHLSITEHIRCLHHLAVMNIKDKEKSLKGAREQNTFHIEEQEGESHVASLQKPLKQEESGMNYFKY